MTSLNLGLTVGLTFSIGYAFAKASSDRVFSWGTGVRVSAWLVMIPLARAAIELAVVVTAPKNLEFIRIKLPST